MDTAPVKRVLDTIRQSSQLVLSQNLKLQE